MITERVERPASCHHEELSYSDFVVFGSVHRPVPLFALCVFIGYVCVSCECPFIGASKQPSIDPLDLLDVFYRGTSCLESPMYSLYTLARSDHEAIRLSVVCMV